MSDLDQRIASWRRELTSKFSDQPDVLDELEDHLRNEFEQLVLAGKSTDDAWRDAVSQLGEPSRLAEEFRKSAHAGWLPARIAFFALCTLGVVLGAALWSRAASAGMGWLLATHVFAITIGYAASLTFGGIAAGMVVAHARGTFAARQQAAFRRSGIALLSVGIVLTFIGIVLGAIWWHQRHGQFWTWTAPEVLALCILGWNCAVLVCLTRSITTAAMVGGVIGNAVVILGWAAPLLFASPRPYGSPTWFAPLIALVVMSQLGLALAGVLPTGWAVRRATRHGIS